MADGDQRIGGRTLIVHRYFWPENFTFPVMLRDIAVMHCARGERVTVVTGDSGDFAGARQAEFGDAVAVRAFAAPVDRGLSGAKRGVHAARLLAHGLATLLSGRWQAFYSVSYPPGVAGMLLLVNRLTGRSDHSIHYVQDMFGYRIANPLVRRLYGWWMGVTVRAAHHIVTLSDEMKDQLIAYTPAGSQAKAAAKIVVLNNFAIDAAPGMAAGAPSRDIIYAGAHGKAQNLDHMLRALALIPVGERPSVDFFGDGETKAGLVSLADALGLSGSVRFHDPVSREAISLEIAASRFGLVGATPDLMRYAFPSKTVSYAAIGTPSLMMADPAGKTARWLHATGLGQPIHPADPAQAARDIMAALAGDAADRSAIVAAAAAAFDRDRYLERLSALSR